jgi:hypothetical protein
MGSLKPSKALLPRPAVFSEQPYSCSAEGTILLWDASSLTVNSFFRDGGFNRGYEI